ncbi:MAG: valine--tRNA ligase, partial [Muribaculaceae bacterium]|nr:valine--tRNA ligase [Muribaculaceae bacterium]
TAQLPQPETPDREKISAFETLKEIIAGIRTVRKQKQIPQKETLTLNVKGAHDGSLDAVISKMGNLSEITLVEEKDPTASAFIVGATEYSIPLESKINVEEELEKLNKDLLYYEKFLVGVEKKLSNDKFVANAPESVVAIEHKKRSDAKEKIEAIKASIAALRK